MVNIRFIAVLSAAALLCPGGAEAERGRKKKPEGPPILSDEYLERLEDRLKLEGKQKDKVESVVKSARPGIKRKWDDLQKLQKRVEALSKKLRNSMREVSENIREQLDYDQKEKFDEMRMRQKWRQRRRPPSRPEGPERRGRRPDPREFPPERFEMDIPGNRMRDLPPELRERIEERQRRRMDMEPGYQRDLPPVEEWNDRHRRFFNDKPPIRPDDDQ